MGFKKSLFTFARDSMFSVAFGVSVVAFALGSVAGIFAATGYGASAAAAFVGGGGAGIVAGAIAGVLSLSGAVGVCFLVGYGACEGIKAIDEKYNLLKPLQCFAGGVAGFGIFIAALSSISSPSAPQNDQDFSAVPEPATV